MGAIITRLESEPTGPYVDRLPILLHGVGVGGYEHRFVAGTLGDAGTPVTSWGDTKGSEPLNQKAGSPVVSDVDGVRCVVLNGAALWRSSFSTTQRTIAVVMRLLAADGVNCGLVGSIVGNPHPGLLRTTGNQVGLFSPSGAAATSAPANAAIKQWGVVFMRLGAAATVRVNAAGTDIAPATNGNGFVGLELGRSGGVTSHVAVAETITWPTVLTDTQMQTVQSALRRQYPALPA